MKKIAVISLVSTLMVTLIQAGQKPPKMFDPDTRMLMLTPQNFQQVVDEHKDVFVQFCYRESKDCAGLNDELISQVLDWLEKDPQENLKIAYFEASLEDLSDEEVDAKFDIILKYMKEP